MTRRVYNNIWRLLLAVMVLITMAQAQDREGERPARKAPPPKKEVKQNIPAPAQVEAPADTSTASPFAEPETLKTMPVRSKLYWYDLNSTLHSGDDTSAYEVYRFSDQKSLIFSDVGSILQYQPLLFVYDLQEMNRPTYVAGLNQYPHQNSIFYNSILMNDPAHGMYNLQFLSVENTRFIEAAGGAGNFHSYTSGSSEQIGITSAHRHTPASWTRIFYKQGNFGYTDLDISFVKPVTEHVALQLGGFSRQYDGSITNGDHLGYNFRGELTWQYSPALYFSTQFHLGRERTGMTAYIPDPDLTLPRLVENRDDFFFDLTWLPQDSTSERVHLVLYNGYTYRRLKDLEDQGYKQETHVNRYGADVNYNVRFKRLEFLAGLGTMLPKVSGTAFEKDYYPSSLNAYGTITLALNGKISLQAAGQLLFPRNFTTQLQPSFTFTWKPDSQQTLMAELVRAVRIPTVTERFFNFDSLYGNGDLGVEEHRSARLRYTVLLTPKWKVSVLGGAHWIRDEIGWSEPKFYNAGSRDFYYLAAGSDFSFWRIGIRGGGQYTWADLNLTSRCSFWLGGHFSQVLLKGALLLDAYGTVVFFDRHRVLNFEQQLERFYPGNGNEQGYYTLNWRVVATVKKAEIFAEAENSLSKKYEVINGYREFFIRFRFGVNWMLWD